MSQHTLDRETRAARQAMDLGLPADEVRRALLLREALRLRGQDAPLLPLLARLLPPAARAQLLRDHPPASASVDDESEALSVRWARRSRQEDPDSVRRVLVGCESTRGYVGVLPLPGGADSLGRDGSAPSQSARFEGAIGGYELLNEIARGGMGVVYRARDPRLEREVALKVLSGVDDEEARERFAIEARATARLSHPHIVGIQAVGEDQGRPYLVMDLVEGRSLMAELEERGTFQPRQAAELVRDLADALAYAHARAILHRDLKPHNVLLDRSGRARLTDFGLAKEVARGEAITATGQVLGTPAYMSPEQALGDAQLIDRRSDVYGLGATLYALLTGRPPFRGATVWNVLDAVAHDPVEAPSALCPELPRDLETIVLTCLEKEPDQRYGTMQALRDDLQRYLDDLPISARRPGLGERLRRGLRRHRRLVLAGGVLGLALVAVGSAAWFRATAANVAAAEEAAREARARYEAAEQAPLEERTGLALRALQTALLRYEVQGTPAERDLVQATSAFAEVAAEGRQWAVGLEALRQTELLERLGQANREALAQKRQALEGAREALVQRRVREVEAVLADLESGRLADVSDAVVIITRNPGAETTQLLSQRLRVLNDELDRRTREALLEAARPTPLERAAGEAAIEGVLEAWERFSDPEREVLSEPALARLGQRLLQRAKLFNADRAAAHSVLRRLQDQALSDPQIRLLRALCRSLGQLGATEAFPLLKRNFRLWLVEENAQAAARGLFWLGTPASVQFLLDHRERFGGPGSSLHSFIARRCATERVADQSGRLSQTMARAEHALESGEFDESLRLLEVAYELAGQERRSAQPEILARTAVVLVELDRADEARARIRAALERSPTLIRAHLVRAQLHLREGNLDRAEQACEEALRLGPELAAPHVMRAQLLAERGRLEPASQAIQRALELNSRSRTARFVQAKIAAKRADWDAALEALDLYCAQTPYDLESQVRALDYCLWSSRPAEVLERSAKLLTLQELPPALRVLVLDRRGSAALARSQPQLAEQAFAQLSRLDPSSPLGPIGLGQAYVQTSRVAAAQAATEEARRLVSEGASLDPRSRDRLLLLEIQLLLFRGQTRQALALCDRHLDQDQSLLLIRTTRADLRLKLGDLAGARADLAVCLQQDPNDYSVLVLLGYVRLFERRFPEAEQVFAQLLSRSNQSRVLLGRAMARMGQRDFAGAAEDASAALAGGSQETELYLLRGRALAAQGQSSLARSDFEVALRQGSPRQQARARDYLARLPR